MFMCVVTKMPPYVHNFVYSELLFICGDVSIRFDGIGDNDMLEWLLLVWFVYPRQHFFSHVGTSQLPFGYYTRSMVGSSV